LESTSGSSPYFEVDVPGQPRQRYLEGGKPITAAEAHGYIPKVSASGAAAAAGVEAAGASGLAAIFFGIAATLYSSPTY
jgi:hypothetical protein